MFGGRGSNLAADGLGSGSMATGGNTLSLSLLDLVHNEITAVTSALRRNLNRRGFTSSAAYTQAAALALHTTLHGLPPVDLASADPELVAAASASLPVLTPSTLVSTTTMSLTMPALSAAARTLASLQQGKAGQAPRRQSLFLSATQGASPAAGAHAVSSDAAAGAHEERTALAPRTPHALGSSSASTDDPLSLLTRFTLLRAQLRTHSTNSTAPLSAFPLHFLVEPFLKVVLSPKTTGATTAIALTSVQRFIVYGIIPAPRLVRDTGAAPRLAASTEQGTLPTVVAEIAHALSHSRFEASTPSSTESASSDELVLIRILDLMRVLICPVAPGSHSPALADLLSDEAICELMETGLSMCCQTRLSELLRKTAQTHMSEMLGSIFRRLDTLSLAPTVPSSTLAGQDGAAADLPSALSSTAADSASSDPEQVPHNFPPSGPNSPATEHKTHMRRMTMPDPKSLAIPAAATAEALSAVSEEEGEQAAQVDADGAEAEAISSTAEKAEKLETEGAGAGQERMEAPAVIGSVTGEVQAETPKVPAEPYGLPAITEILRVLCFLIDSHDANNNDTMRLLSMQLLTPLLESSGAAISSFPDLRSLLTDVAAKHLFQLARNSPGASSGSGLSFAAAEANAMQLQMVGASLRAITTLFAAMKPHLKLQFELFVAFCLDRLAPTFPFTMEPWKEGALAMAAARRAQVPLTPVDAPAGGAPPPPPPPPPMPKTSERAPATGETRELTLETFNMLFRGFERHGASAAIPTADGVAASGSFLGLTGTEGGAMGLGGSGAQTPVMGGHAAVEDVMVTLWVNYDCDSHCEDLYDRIVRFLCRAIHATNPAHSTSSSSGSAPDAAGSSGPTLQDGTQILALDAILNLISGMASRQEALDAEGAANRAPVDGALDPRALSQRKHMKGLILDAANRFNAKPKDGVKWMAEKGLIIADGSEQERAKSLAAFLKDCPGLDKKLLGDYISRPDNLNVLETFISLFDFHGKSIADALRELLETFRLPGEAQQIARITETFAKIFFDHKPPEIASEDATYVLSYSVIMLNTDQHNPQNKRKMQVEDYRRNLRGVNDGKDFDPEYLGNIFESIKKREIVMPEEHLGQLGFEYAWKELVRRSRTGGLMLPCGSADFDQAMFENSWQPIVASLAHAFSSFQDEYLLERAITGFRQCATLARKFGMNDVFDFMVHGLSAVTGLLDDGSIPKPPTTNAQVDIEGQKITVSPLSIRFGMNFKGQLAAVVLFTIANGNGDAIRSSWADIFEIFKNLFANTLLPESMLTMQDFSVTTGRSQIPLKAKKLPGAVQADARAQGGGLFSTLSSYLLAPMSSEKEAVPQDVTEQDVESSLSTIDCVASCNLEDLYEQIKHLRGDALLAAIRSLQGLAERLVSQASKGESASTGTSTPTQAAVAQSRLLTNARYDASAVFAMEMFADLACSDADLLPQTWQMVYQLVSSMLSSPKAHHPLMIERAVVITLRLIHQAGVLLSESAPDGLEKRTVRDQLFLALDTIRSLPAELRSVVSLQLLGGLVPVVSASPAFARSSTEWGLLLALIGEHSKGPGASAVAVRLGFLAVSQGVDASVTAENILGFLALLRDYASEAELNAAGSSSSGSAGGGVNGSPGGKGRREPPARQTLTEKKELAEADDARRERAVEAVSALEALRHKIPGVISSSQVPYADAWKQIWVTLLNALMTQCLSSDRALRQAAITHSQRACLCSEVLPTAPVDVRPIFDQVLFPILEEFTKPVVIQRDPGVGGMQEARLRVCALACKLFLHLLSPLSSSSDTDLQEVWLTLLDFFDRFMTGGKKDQLTEAIPENLKNVLLVMSASNILIPPAPAGQPDERTKAQAILWAVTFDRLKRFLPGLEEEIFPPPPPPPAAAPPAATPAPVEAPEAAASTEVAEESVSAPAEAAAPAADGSDDLVPPPTDASTVDNGEPKEEAA
ncbi:hypothetical protein CF327_g3176 [Tilletia walkeri]|uniref:SEC7 domain-containing protein n=1 Tax=Tilletia walkeri TaxID=117179 RepID=A0A8X7N6U5_9BASI|nr:hypothetical protein CF327_g3176 [Tilletia walkeri]KAE8266855.1 hypothetical protein A4X09_0g5489 [Tilletia walkeri]